MIWETPTAVEVPGTSAIVRRVREVLRREEHPEQFKASDKKKNAAKRSADPDKYRRVRREAYIALSPEHKANWIGRGTENRRRVMAENPVHYLWIRSRESAKQRDLEHTIGEHEIVIPVNCPVCDCVLQSKGTRGAASPSLDRVHNDGGYVPGNVAVICLRCNMLKKDGSIADFERLIAYMRGKIQ